MRPFRSVLYIPASNERALAKAQSLPCDAIIFDLEDAVTPDRKPEALALLIAALKSTDYGHRARIVRVNDAADAAALEAVDLEAVLIPKVNTAADLDIATRHPLWAMMETAKGVLNAAEIAAHPRLRGMVMGTNDLNRELGSREVAGRLPMLASFGHCLLAARANGRVIIDGVFGSFRDLDGLRAECEQGRDMGFDGKTVIHPVQIDTANDVFGPAVDEIDLARRQIEAHDAALRLGKGVAVVDGRIVENLHIVTARQTLARAEAIAAI